MKMRKILIDDRLREIAKKYAKKLFVSRDDEFQRPLAILTKLHDDIPAKEIKYRQYVDKIITEYEPILSATPDKMRTLIREFDALNVDVNRKIPNKKIKFYEAIVSAMRYDALRDKESIPYLKNSGIRVCVYCNSQYALTVENIYYRYTKKRKIRKQVRERKALLELDHYYPKSVYPFLCTSFFNLYPVCSSCNRSKSDSEEIFFELYTENTVQNLNTFNFRIDDESLVRYKTCKRCSVLKFGFEAINSRDNDLKEGHNKTFCIEGIYKTQQDLAEEIIIKSDIYTPAYKKSLLTSFGSAICDESMLNRLILGNYSKEEDIHKRPLAKFTQDLAIQLGLI